MGKIFVGIESVMFTQQQKHNFSTRTSLYNKNFKKMKEKKSFGHKRFMEYFSKNNDKLGFLSESRLANVDMKCPFSRTSKH